MGNVIAINSKRPTQSLEHLNRLTGLDFDAWPESLLNAPVSGGAVLGDTAAPPLTQTAFEQSTSQPAFLQLVAQN